MFLVEGMMKAGDERLRKVWEYSVLRMVERMFEVNVVIVGVEKSL